MIDPSPALVALLNRKPPQRLYHYTSVGGIDGIARSKVVWASAAQYMNDAQEFRLALDIARRLLRKEADAAESRARAFILDYLSEQLERAEQLEICVFSLSEDGDLLSQWRGYCPPNGGYSLGFDAGALRSSVVTQGVYLAPCVYGPIDHERIVLDALRPVLERVPNTSESQGPDLRAEAEKYSAVLFEQIIFVAPLIKHTSFAEEKEWRLIWMPGRLDILSLKYRQGPGLLVPFVEVSLSGEDGLVPLEEIIVGPMPHQEAALRALSGALQNQGYSPKRYSLSQVPYRTW
ncbi:MAG: DUF2971 domain-containing protein [Dehalococcoidia bacterium]